jgi:HEAT repeat protein
MKAPQTTRRKKLLALLVLLACAAVLVVLRTREPRYNGRRLTSWLQQCTDTPLSDTNQLTEARNAIRAIGAERSLPTLLKLITAKDTVFSKWTMDVSKKFKVPFFRWSDETDCHLNGLAGFEVLGSNAAPALGALTKLLNHKDSALMAERSLEYIGKPAEGALCQCLTNRDWRVRSFSILALAGVTDDVETYISRVKGCLNDTNSEVQVSAVEGIGSQVHAPDLAIPILKQTLNSTDDFVSATSAEMIRGFGTNGEPTFSALTNLIASGRLRPAGIALQALAVVAPARAVPILSNTVVNGHISLQIEALRDLRSIAPDLCVHMTLAELRSPDPQRRSQALAVVVNFDLNSPGIVDALKLARQDDNPQVAEHAEIAIRQMLRSEKIKTHEVVCFPDDPEYQGKPLGEWLQMRHDSWELSTDAVEALRNMGTNAVPLLLRRLEFKDPVFGEPDWDVSMEGLSGLISLGELARPALPRLAELIDTGDTELAVRATMASLGTGEYAIPCLIKGLTNRFPDVRNQTADCLTGDWSSKYPEAGQQLVPYLVALLNDPDRDVGMSASNALRHLDRQAAANPGIK